MGAKSLLNGYRSRCQAYQAEQDATIRHLKRIEAMLARGDVEGAKREVSAARDVVEPLRHNPDWVAMREAQK